MIPEPRPVCQAFVSDAICILLCARCRNIYSAHERHDKEDGMDGQRFVVELKRSVDQRTFVIVRATDEPHAIARALELARSGLAWRDGDEIYGPVAEGAPHAVAER